MSAKDIMGDEPQEVITLEDGTEVSGYRVLNRYISLTFNCDAGGFFSLKQGGFVGENVKVDGFNLNGELVLKQGMIGPEAKVYGHAELYGWARIKDRAEVFGNAKVYGWSTINEAAKVYGDSSVHGWTWVTGSAKVFDFAEIYGEAHVNNFAEVSGHTKVYGQSRISGNARIKGHTEVHGKAWVDGNSYITGKAEICGEARITQNAKITNAEVYGFLTVCKNTHLYGGKWGGCRIIDLTPIHSQSDPSNLHDPFILGGLLYEDSKRPGES